MHKRALLTTTAFTFAVISFASAQEAPNSHTLNEQLQNVQAGKPAVPMAGHSHSSANMNSGSMSSGKSHKASPLKDSSPSAAPSSLTPVAYDNHGQPIDSNGGGAIPALPLQEMVSGNIHFITGGVGDEEVDQLKSVENAFNFHLLITAGQGEYLSGATLRLKDANGVDVLATGGAGPYFYANVPPGNYTLDITTAQGANQSVKVTVPKNGDLKKTVQFNV
jgi:hypothetical protein